MNRRTFIQAAAATTVATAAAGASLYAWKEEDTHDVEIATVPLAVGLNTPLRIALLGDIHYDPLCEDAYLGRVIDLVNSLQTDIILYTGDFITAHGNRVGHLADMLSRATSRLGAFAVPGNHEHWTGIWGITHALETRGGIRMIRNQTVALPGEDGFYLTGLDSFWAGTPDLTIFSRTPDNSRHLVLVHEPDSFTQLDDPRIKLQMSGHTHGGQIRIPLYGALFLPKLGRNFETGLFARDGRSLYVNRGIGTLKPHVRVNCRPEITVFELA